MPIEQKRFSGLLNLDDRPEFVLANQHINSLNGRFYGGAQGLTFQNIPGNTLISNSLPAGSNQCIGSFFDSLKQRIFWFNYNSNGRNGIYKYDIATNTITNLLLSFTDSATDIFSFSLDYPIASVNIIYTTEQDGDILTWTDRLNRPKELNILDAENNLYGALWLAEYLDVAKDPPVVPIACAYENDATVTVNNLKNKLYRFKYRYIYGTFQKSTWSTISIMPQPFKYTDQAIDTDQTKNCRIGLIFQTGETDVIKIEIAAQENLGITWGNFFSIQILDKSQLSIPNKDLYIYNFYNNEAYDYVDLQESILDFDRVPNKANAQELLNGNVIIYGGITEGYNTIVPDVSVANNQLGVQNINTSIGILCSQNGQNGLSTGNIRITLVGNPSAATLIGSNTQILVYVFNGATVDGLQTGVVTGATTLSDLITQLSASATGAGYTIVSSDGHNLVFNRANNLQVLYAYSINGGADSITPVNQSTPAYELSSRYNYGLKYFDGKDKTNGTITDIDFNWNVPPIIFPTTTADSIYINGIILTINHQPPDWAETYQVVRTENLTKSNFLSWVSDRTFKDSEFAYISIQSIAVYKEQYPTSVISYDFLVGDRIKFVALFNNDKTINTSYGNAHDYDIVGTLENPNINGLVQNGLFLKIKLPTTSGTFDFGGFTSNAFYYYYIELYTPAKSVANGLDVYYEFSDMFQIGNPGLSSRYHQGSSGIQVPGVTPATLLISNGDYYYRVRGIRAGAFFRASTLPDVTYSWVNEPIYQQTIDSVPVGTSYQVKNTTAGNTSNANNWLIKTGTSAVTFNIKGKLQFRALQSTPNQLIVYLLFRNIGGGGTGLTQLASITGASNGQIIEFNIEQNVTVPASKTAVIYLQESPVSSPTPFSANALSGQLTFVDTEHDFNVAVIDPNFSDFFESKVNSNGRTSVVNPDEQETFYSTLVRWGLAYQQNTNINQINRFYPANFDEIDRSKGDIQRMKTRDRILRIFQNRACGQYGVFSRFIENNEGDNQLVTTNDIITKGNINYYAGEYGLGDQFTSLVSSKNADYFVDVVRGYQVRLSNDGLIPISELYKGQFYIRDLLTPYNQTHLRTDGSKAKILGCYDFFDEQWVCALQAATDLSANTFSFNEKRNGYCSFYSYAPEWLESAEDVIYTWLNGALWKHNNTTAYSSFYGIQYDCSITLVFNLNYLEKKTWESITELASAIWSCPLISGNVYSYGSTLQQTMLGDYDFANLESCFEAAILRDQNSIGGIINGDIMKGNWLQVKLLKQNASDLIWLSEVSMLYKDSPLTNK